MMEKKSQQNQKRQKGNKRCEKKMVEDCEAK